MESFEHALPAGTLIDERYRIDSVLGEGGFAITYKAFDTKLQCDVAIKEFLPNDLAARSSDTKTVQPRTNRNDDYSFGLTKFLDEARTLAQLQHPHIVQVTNFIEAHGTGYLVMTYSEGQELGDWLKTQPGQLSEEAVLGIVTPILEGLTRVHEQGLLHRDIKPGNIFLRNVDGPMLIDFGAARQAIGEKSKSISAIISQGYAPPEQYTTRGKQGAFTDLYAIGATLYRLIIGQTPVDAADRSHAKAEEEQDPLAPASEAGKGKVSDWLLQLTDQLLAISPKQRPQSAEAVLGAIKNKTTAVIDTAATSSTQKTNKKTRVIKDGERFTSESTSKNLSNNKSKLGLYVGGVVAVLLVIGAGIYVNQQATNDGSENSSDKKPTKQKQNNPLTQGKAILSLDSIPSGAEVFLDNNLLGKTPYRGDNLAQGIFELKLKHESSNDLIESLQLTDNLVTKKRLALTPAIGRFSVVSKPEGASISIDGKATGKQTPESLINLTVGKHELLLTKDAYSPRKETIYVRKNETMRGDFNLKRATVSDLKSSVIDSYQSSCFACHGTGAAGAPKTGDKGAWKSRIAQGMDVLFDHAINGFKGMPAKGGNYDLSDDVIKAVVKHMVKKSKGIEPEEKSKAEQKKKRLEKVARAKAEADIKVLEESENLAREEEVKQAKVKAKQERIAEKSKWTGYHPAMVRIPAGDFRMGDLDGGGQPKEKPVHSVSISAFSISETQVTFANWDACVKAGGCSHQPKDQDWGRGNHPVMNVSYDDITTQFIPWLNKITGKRYRLPSEAEWEYAARAGSTTIYSWGNDINCTQLRYGYYSDDCGKQESTDPVKSFSANAFGLYDMHGNVWDWVQDCWNEDYNGAPTDGGAWTSGDCSLRVFRGGSWASQPANVRSANRGWRHMTTRGDRGGFRLVQDLD